MFPFCYFHLKQNIPTITPAKSATKKFMMSIKALCTQGDTSMMNCIEK